MHLVGFFVILKKRGELLIDRQRMREKCLFCCALGAFVGMVTQLPEDDRYSMTRKEMLARLVVCMGGRAAEERIFGRDDVTSGASSDVTQATRLARAMVTRFAMSDKVCLI